MPREKNGKYTETETRERENGFTQNPENHPKKKEIIVETHPKWQKLYVYTIAIPFELCLNHINI